MNLRMNVSTTINCTYTSIHSYVSTRGSPFRAVLTAACWYIQRFFQLCYVFNVLLHIIGCLFVHCCQPSNQVCSQDYLFSWNIIYVFFINRSPYLMLITCTTAYLYSCVAPHWVNIRIVICVYCPGHLPYQLIIEQYATNWISTLHYTNLPSTLHSLTPLNNCAGCPSCWSGHF